MYIIVIFACSNFFLIQHFIYTGPKPKPAPKTFMIFICHVANTDISFLQNLLVSVILMPLHIVVHLVGIVFISVVKLTRDDIHVIPLSHPQTCIGRVSTKNSSVWHEVRPSHDWPSHMSHSAQVKSQMIWCRCTQRHKVKTKSKTLWGWVETSEHCTCLYNRCSLGGFAETITVSRCLLHLMVQRLNA